MSIGKIAGKSPFFDVAGTGCDPQASTSSLVAADPPKTSPLPLLSSFSYFLSHVLSSPSSLTLLASLRKREECKTRSRNN
jgi:hypothetical protein